MRFAPATPMITQRMTLTPEPIVILENAFQDPYNNAVATARTCYSSQVIRSGDVSKDEGTRARRDAIAQSIYKAGHHTTIQHATFQFVLDKVSRQVIWSFLHSHPFYNSKSRSASATVEIEAGQLHGFPLCRKITCRFTSRRSRSSWTLITRLRRLLGSLRRHQRI